MNNILKINTIIKKTDVELNLLTGIHEPLHYEISSYFSNNKILNSKDLAHELGKFYKNNKNNKNNHYEQIALLKTNNYKEELIKRRLFSYYIFYSLLKDLNLYNSKKDKLTILKSNISLDNKIKQLKEITTVHGLLILTPGSINITSDWDLTIICSRTIIDILLKVNVNKDSFSYYYAKSINVEPTFYGILNNTHSLIYDNNFYIDLLLLPKNSNFHQYNKFPKIIKKLLNNEYISLFKYKKNYYKEEINMIHNKLKKKGVIKQPSLKKQLFLYENIMKNINNDIDTSFTNYLESRNYKSEAYQSLSSVLVSVIKSQLNINVILTKENYLINSIENFIDFYLHSNNKYIRTINQKLLIKLSKYLLRFFNSILKYKKSKYLNYYLNPTKILVNMRSKNNNININKNLSVNEDYKEIFRHELTSYNINIKNKIEYDKFIHYTTLFFKTQFNEKLLINNPKKFDEYLYNILNSNITLKKKCFKMIQLAKTKL